MCGIFSIINYNYQPFTNDDLLKYKEHFYYGKSRGPENSYFKEINNYILYGFHRLAINGLDEISNQPIINDGIYLICNGEIYNYQFIYKQLNIKPKTNSDCESIIHLYKKYGISYTLQNLDGVFSFLLYDSKINKLFIARDPYGVRPLYYGIDNNSIGVSSLLKQISGLYTNCINFKAGTYITFNFNKPIRIENITREIYHTFSFRNYQVDTQLINNNTLIPYYETIYRYLYEAVKKRVITSERKIACLLSGGLDSSLITSLVSSFIPLGQLETYSIGMAGGTDLIYAKKVADHIKCKHTEVLLNESDFLDAIPEVIYAIESYDTTTVRASVGNYLISKYISENSDAKVIFNGDGSDELTGGYLYFHNCPSDIEFDFECKRLLSNLQYYDVLRSDRTISCHGLEARTPFLDRTFVSEYLKIPAIIRNHNTFRQTEKFLLRKTIEYKNNNLLPPSVLWRTKEAFSDGVSANNNSWFEIIQNFINNEYSDEEFYEKSSKYKINRPNTKEQLYYREIFESYFPNKGNVIPGFWMPKYSKTDDASARTLDIYKNIQK